MGTDTKVTTATRPPVSGPLLYVSSDHASRILFTRIARRWTQMKLLVAEGGRAGVQLAAERRPRIVVLEGHLPDVDGEEAVIGLRQRPALSHVPILVLSDDDSPNTRARFTWAGANAYMTKPLDVSKVDRTISDFLEAEALA